MTRILVVGDVVSLRRRLKWFESKPRRGKSLFGRRILVTRAADKAGPLVERLRALGAEVEELPAIALVPVKPDGAFRQALHELPEADWVFFTSPEGIGWFSKILKPHRKDLRSLAWRRIAAIGPKTAAAIEEAGLHVDFVPRRFSQEGLLEGLPAKLVRGKRALIFSAQGSRDVLAEGLRRRGMSVRRVPIYRTVLPRALAAGIVQALQRPFDVVTVTSASCVEHVHDALQQAGRSTAFPQLRFASIGPVTSSAVRSHGGRVAVEATTSTIEGLVDAIVRASRG